MVAPKTRQVPLDKILIDQGTQCRTALDTQTVRDFRTDLEAGTKMEEVVLFETSDGELIMGDGFTRYAATKAAGGATIEAKILKGERFDALAYNGYANGKHQAQRWTRADRQNAARLILSDSEGATWSDSRIANHCGIGDDKVAEIRAELEAQTGKPGPDKRKSADGRERPAKAPRKKKTAAETNGEAHEEAPKQGRPTVDWKEYDRAMGVVIRFPDEIGRAYPGEKDGTETEAARRVLDTLAKIMAGWRRRLKEIDKANKKGE